MYVSVASKCALDSTGTTTEYSQAVSMQGANSAQIDTTIYTLTATNVTYQLQSSSDLDNWFNQGSSEAKTVVGSYLLTAITGCKLLQRSSGPGAAGASSLKPDRTA